MSYASLPIPEVGAMWTEPEYEQVRENFALSIPDVYTADMQIAAGTGSKTLGVTAPGSDGLALVADSSTATGIAWAGGTVPIGMIIIWSGAWGAIPAGWQICDGTNGTPNLQSRSVIGAGSSYAVGATGGQFGVIISHKHTYSQTVDGLYSSHGHTQVEHTGPGNHRHAISTPVTSYAPVESPVEVSITSNDEYVAEGSHTHDTPANTEYDNTHFHTSPDVDDYLWDHDHATTETDTALNVFIPPLYTLCYIMRLS